MAEELLIELEEGQGLDTALGGLDGLRELFVRQVRQLIPLVGGLASQVRQRWGQLCRAVAAGHLDEVHGLRPALEKVVEARLQHLKQGQRLASMAAALGGEEVPGAAELPRLVLDLERFRERVLGAWKSPEDLEELAVADYPLPAERLKALCATSPPPPAWYEQEDKPF